MAFKQAGSLNPHGAPVIRREILGNSATFAELDSLKLSSGFLVAGTAGALVFGHTIAMSTRQGVGLPTTGAAGAAIGSYVGAYTTASDNQTVGKVKGDVDISKFSLYSAGLTAAIGTTTGSNLSGYKMDLSTAVLLDESSAITGTAQYSNFGVDPANSANALVHIYESQVFGV